MGGSTWVCTPLLLVLQYLVLFSGPVSSKSLLEARLRVLEQQPGHEAISLLSTLRTRTLKLASERDGEEHSISNKLITEQREKDRSAPGNGVGRYSPLSGKDAVHQSPKDTGREGTHTQNSKSSMGSLVEYGPDQAPGKTSSSGNLDRAAPAAGTGHGAGHAGATSALKDGVHSHMGSKNLSGSSSHSTATATSNKDGSRAGHRAANGPNPHQVAARFGSRHTASSIQGTSGAHWGEAMGDEGMPGGSPRTHPALNKTRRADENPQEARGQAGGKQPFDSAPSHDSTASQGDHATKARSTDSEKRHSSRNALNVGHGHDTTNNRSVANGSREKGNETEDTEMSGMLVKQSSATAPQGNETDTLGHEDNISTHIHEKMSHYTAAAIRSNLELLASLNKSAAHQNTSEHVDTHPTPAPVSGLTNISRDPSRRLKHQEGGKNTSAVAYISKAWLFQNQGGEDSLEVKGNTTSTSPLSAISQNLENPQADEEIEDDSLHAVARKLLHMGEEDITLMGVLEVLQGTGVSAPVHLLHLPGGIILSLVYEGATQDVRLITGIVVRVQGHLDNDELRMFLQMTQPSTSNVDPILFSGPYNFFVDSAEVVSVVPLGQDAKGGEATAVLEAPSLSASTSQGGTLAPTMALGNAGLLPTREAKQNINLGIIILKLCNMTVPTISEVQAILQGKPTANGRTPNLADMFNSCSFGQVNITSQVFQAEWCPTDVKSSCNYQGWAKEANSRLTAQGARFTRFDHLVYIYPRSVGRTDDSCYLGLAYNDCRNTRSNCWAWIRSDAATHLDSYLHELGHNLGLEHSWKSDGSISDGWWEYQDLSCSMGYSKNNVRCFNAPHMFDLGWAKIKTLLTQRELAPGNTQQVQVPMQASTLTSALVVRPNWVNWNSVINFWVSYRRSEGYDVLVPALNNTLQVHLYQSTASRPTGEVMERLSVQLASLSPGELYFEPLASLTIRFQGLDKNQAVVTVCRNSTSFEIGFDQCMDGLDNDCDGVTDAENEICRGYEVWPPAADADFFYGGYRHLLFTGSKKVTYFDAERVCQAHAARLTTLMGADDEDALATKFRELSGGQGAFWIGYNAASSAKPTTSSFKWLDGSNVTYVNWREKFPANVSMAACGQVQVTPGDVWARWVNKDCGKHVANFACRAPSPPAVVSSIVVDRENTTYTMYKHATSYTDATNTCQRLRGSLLTITSATEADAVADLLRKASPGASLVHAWLAIDDTVNPKLTTWADGSRLSYHLWAPSEPSQASMESARCGRLEVTPTTSYWYVGPCNEVRPFVCKGQAALLNQVTALRQTALEAEAKGRDLLLASPPKIAYWSPNSKTYSATQPRSINPLAIPLPVPLSPPLSSIPLPYSSPTPSVTKSATDVSDVSNLAMASADKGKASAVTGPSVLEVPNSSSAVKKTKSSSVSPGVVAVITLLLLAACAAVGFVYLVKKRNVAWARRLVFWR